MLSALILAALVNYNTPCEDWVHGPEAKCVTIIDPYDGSLIRVGCNDGKACPDWPEGKVDMDWLGRCIISDYVTVSTTNCPIYINARYQDGSSYLGE